jgi:hypothetical protein
MAQQQHPQQVLQADKQLQQHLDQQQRLLVLRGQATNHHRGWLREQQQLLRRVVEPKHVDKQQ